MTTEVISVMEREFQEFLETCDRLFNNSKQLFKYNTIYGLVHNTGELFKDIRNGRELGIGGLPKSCYFNCFHISQLFPDKYLYCEGYALAKKPFSFPVNHAWLYDKENNFCVDPTWDLSDNVAIAKGFKFRNSYIDEKLKEYGEYGILENLYRDKNRNNFFINGFRDDVIIP